MTARLVVCRCEDVTLGDVRRAVEHGYRDVESVKRYTGFGTGWCQGKQCSALVARVLARLTGEPPDAPFTARPPFRPVALGHLAALLADEESDASRKPR
ncbi:MAG: (2Fe-2S)-binding protein [Myxococcota bacterium]|nr:(2Fe-2S)-binding protein [Myxococcota bacterium]MDW8361607.1 (2Fe-2S)-binding protein [Myxococcales bacterium]